MNFVPLHFDRAPEKLHGSPRAGVMLEVLGFGLAIAAVGACIVVISSQRYEDGTAAAGHR